MRGKLGIFASRIESGPTVLTIESTEIFISTDTASFKAVTLPSGIQSGDLLIMIFRPGNDITSSPPSGWDEVASRSDNGSTYIFKRIANGSEGSFVTVNLSSGARTPFITYRISGWTEGVEASFVGSNTNNPPSITASWGSKLNLFISVLTNRRTDSSVTAQPSGYDGFLTAAQASSALTSRARVSTAHLFAESASEDPAAFTTSGTIDNPHSATIVIG